MKVVSVEQARRHRLRAHHLDRAYGIEDAAELAGACGMQNTPPGAWETALFNRAPACRREDAERLLYGEKTLVQAWSLRGAPVVFPAAESAAFLSALVPAKGEPWAYTKGIGLALDALGMEFDRLLELLVLARPRLDDEAIASKVALGVTLVFFIVFFNVFQGVREVNPNVLASARMLGANRKQLLKNVYLPSAMSWVFSSLHTSVGMAFVGAVVGEYLGSSHGVGYLILQAEGVFDINTVMAGILVLTIFALVLDWLVGIVERRAMRWQPHAGASRTLKGGSM